MAARVSAVSPDCEMTMHRVLSVTIGFRYRSSEAYSTSTGTRARLSSMCSPIRAECQLVPQAVMRMLSNLSSSSSVMLSPPSLEVPCSSSSRPRMQFSTVSGEDRDVAVVEIIDFACLCEDGRHIAGDVVLAVAESDEQRAALSRRHDLVFVLTRHDSYPVRALDLPQG